MVLYSDISQFFNGRIKIKIGVGLLILTSITSRTASSQSVGDSLHAEAHSAYEIGDYQTSFDFCASACRQYHRTNNHTKGYRQVLKLISRLSGDELHNEILQFFSDESKYMLVIDPALSAYIWRYVGLYYAINNRSRTALRYYEKATTLLDVINDTIYSPYVHSVAAQTICETTLDGHSALDHAQRAIDIYKTKKNINKKILAKLLYTKGWAYRTIDEALSIKYLVQALKLKNNDGRIIDMLIRCHLGLEQYQAAHDLALDRINKLKLDNETPSIELQYLYGQTLIGTNRHEQAVKEITQALQRAEVVYGGDELDKTILYYFLASALAANNENDPALRNCQIYYENSIPNYHSVGLMDFPAPDFRNFDLFVLDALQLQASIIERKFEASQDPVFLSLAIQIQERIILEVERRRQHMSIRKSKLLINKWTFDTYDDALLNAVRLYQVDSSHSTKSLILNLFDRSKETVSRDIEQLERIRHNLSEEIKMEEDSLLDQLALVNEQIRSNINTEASKKLLVDIRFAWRKFQGRHYHKRILDHDSRLDWNQFRHQLKDNEQLLAFHQADSQLVCLNIRKKSFNIWTKNINSEFSHDANHLKKYLTDWQYLVDSFDSSKSKVDFYRKKVSAWLLDDHVASTEIISIIPDGMLHSIPFDLLCWKGSDTYLLDKSTIHYSYRLSAFPKSNDLINNEHVFTGISPPYAKLDASSLILRGEKHHDQQDDSYLWRSLPSGRANTLYLANLFDGTAFVDRPTSKVEFETHVKNSQMLHFAMHAEVGPKNIPRLILSNQENDYIFLDEIQQMSIQAELVTLSACNSGVGDIQVGEGPYSLAKAFSEAGAVSIVMSLWPVADVQTARIMKYFYSHIKNGSAKNIALKQAKLDYLASATDWEKHPAFWAGFVLIGDTGPVVLSRNNHDYVVWLIFLFLTMAITLYFWNRYSA